MSDINDSELEMSFREKIAWLSLGGILIAFGPYFFSLVVLGGTPWSLGPASAARLMVGVAVLIVVMLIGTIGLAVTSLRDAGHPSDERDSAIARRASAIAYPVLLAAIFLALGTLFFTRDRSVLINALLAAVMLAELLRYTLEITGYRRDR